MPRKTYKQNHERAWCYFKALGLIPIDAKKNEWVLHHKDVSLRHNDPKRYDEWRIDDLIPMKRHDHAILHGTNRKKSEEEIAKIRQRMRGRVLSEETRKKISEKCKGRKIPEDEIKRRVATYKLRHPKKEKPPKILKTKDEKGLYWITDGTNNTRISKNATIPSGWRKGRSHLIYKTKPGPKSKQICN